LNRNKSTGPYETAAGRIVEKCMPVGKYDLPVATKIYFERPLIATFFNSLSLWERVGVRVKNRRLLPFTVYAQKNWPRSHRFNMD
jgi:hypothetical protein